MSGSEPAAEGAIPPPTVTWVALKSPMRLPISVSCASEYDLENMGQLMD